jgi:ABC-2 type transport system ATP-binding protein
MDLAESLCDEIILINKGKLIISGQMSEILDYSEKNLYKIYFEKEAEFDCPDDCQIIDKEKTAVTLDIKNLNPGEILQKINLQQNVHEFIRIKPSLHQLFISLVEESNQK